MKLLIIGIDALDPRILMDNIGRFPNMKELIDEGVFSDYFGYADGYGSSDNWVSLYTGLKPEEHGVINNKYKGSSPTRKSYEDKNPFWESLNKNGYSCGLWRILTLDPIEEIDGYMVGGIMNFEFNELEKDEESVEQLRILETSPLYNKFEKIDYIRKIKQIDKDKDKYEQIKYLLREDNYYEESLEYLKYELKYFEESIAKSEEILPVDMLFYYNTTLDLIQHMQQYDPNKRLIVESMVEIDKFIGRIKDKLNPENIIIISDHGSSSFNDLLGRGNEELERESFGMANDAFWLDNGQIVVSARNGGILSGVHDIRATFIASGEKIKQGYIKDMRTIDFYPTILELFDIGVPASREGYVLDVFRDKDIVNKSKVYPLDKIYENILIIQNIEVYNFNKTLNQVFLDNRFSKITVLCQEKYKDIFKLNPRIDKVIGYENDSKDLGLDRFRGSYSSIFIPKKDKVKNTWTYLRI